MSSILTMSATAPYTAAVIAIATATRMTARTHRDSAATSFIAMTMISQERMKSVVMAPLVTLASASGPRSTAGVSSSASCWPRSLCQTFSAPS